MDKETAKQQITELVEKYIRVVRENRVSKYNEETTKIGFIQPLFRALGWDFENSSEVTAEETISKKRVDYGFRVNGIPKFFLEAKALKADLDNPQFADQAINYAWHKDCTWAVLTDFENIKVFNAEWKTDSLSQSTFFSLDSNQFLERFDQLWLLSKESFEQGLLDKEAEKWGKKSKKSLVGEQLFSDLTKWRSELSKDILQRNKDVKEGDLDEAVQRIIDRLIFIRNCEDRELEPPTLLSAIREWDSKRKGSLAENIVKVFKHFDDEYNSKLFQHHLCDDLDMSNQVLEGIIEELYHTRDRSIKYDFAVLDADVLGNVYEQYLGHILKKTAKRATVEEKHAYRKEQGIYYTPTYVVDYIVRNTLGELLKDKKVDVEKIRVLDPACGSGSFLIKAFDVLNEFYGKKEGDRAQTQLDLSTGLPFKQKEKVLLNNIFGVDLDARAVEIAQLNLLLKIAEKKQRLPLLQQNIKRGNSLIEDEKVAGDAAFKWEREFKHIMDEKGFDVVIGNPPYIRVQTTKSEDKKYFVENYVSAQGKFDLYIVFIEKALKLLKENGYFSFIVPNKFTQTKYGKDLKKYILDNFTIIKFIDFGDLKVFGKVTTYPCIIVIKKIKPSQNTMPTYVKVKRLTSDIGNKVMARQGLAHYEDSELKVFRFRQCDLGAELWSFMPKITQEIFNKIDRSSNLRLKELVERIYEGFISGNNSVFFMNKNKIDDLEIEKDLVKPVPKGKNVRRYSIRWEDEFVLFPHQRKGARTEPVDISKYPHAKTYLEQYKNDLIKRDYVMEAGKNWFEIWNTRNLDWFEQDKIVTPNLASANNFAIDFKDNKTGKYFFIDHDCYGIILKDKDRDKYLFLLGLLNSKLIEFFIKQKSPMFSGGYYKYHTQYLEQIPVIEVETAREHQIITLVQKMLSFNKHLNEIGDKKTDERDKIEEEIKRTDAEIDELVYKLYGITEEERKIIEGSLK